MNDTLKNIITSIGTSLIVSSVTFTLGLKSGKNQSDRQILRNKYRDISVYFSDLLNCIQRYKPRKRYEFKLIRTAIGQRYMSLIEEMEINGELIELKGNIITKCKEIEFKLLKYADEDEMKLKSIKECVISQLENNCSNLIKKQDYEITTTKDTIGKVIRTCNYSILISEEQFKYMIKMLKENQLQGICFKNDETPNVFIYKDTLDDISIEDFLNNIHCNLKNEQDIIKLLKEREQLITETNGIIKTVNKRVTEPFTFLETIIGSVTDIFKV